MTHPGDEQHGRRHVEDADVVASEPRHIHMAQPEAVRFRQMQDERGPDGDDQQKQELLAGRHAAFAPADQALDVIERSDDAAENRDRNWQQDRMTPGNIEEQRQTDQHRNHHASAHGRRAALGIVRLRTVDSNLFTKILATQEIDDHATRQKRDEERDSSEDERSRHVFAGITRQLRPAHREQR